ncbi:unnamed protein product [Rotaria sp. Silwood2]|nr:unnamed protein product [Rotaria sp. Silwood2]
MTTSSTAATRSILVHSDLYRQAMNDLYSYIANSEHGYLTQDELFHHYRQQHGNAEISYRFLGYSSLLGLVRSDQALFTNYFHRGIAYIYLTNNIQHTPRHDLYTPDSHIQSNENISTGPSSNLSMIYGAASGVDDLAPIYSSTNRFNPPTEQDLRISTRPSSDSSMPSDSQFFQGSTNREFIGDRVDGRGMEGFNDLNKEDQTELKANFGSSTVRLKRKGDKTLILTNENGDVQKAKQSKKKRILIQHLNKKETNELRKEVPNDVFKELLEHNQQKIVTGESHLIDTVTYCMAFGALEHCPECGGFLIFNYTCYRCTGDVTEQTKCSYTTTTPTRKPFDIPDDIKSEYDDLSVSDKVKLKLKDEAAVDPDSYLRFSKNKIFFFCISLIFKGLQDTYHVLKDTETGGIFTAVLGLVYIIRGTNFYYKMQLLESDNGQQ